MDPPAANSDDHAIDFKFVTARLDALQSLGVTALLLSAPALPAPGTNGEMPNLDSLDDLLRQASGRGIRVLLTIQAAGAKSDISGLARFWLNRGVAGLRISEPAGSSPQDTQSVVQTLRKLESSVAGQRILISDLDLAAPEASPPAHRTIVSRTSRTSDLSAAQLLIDTRPNQLDTFDASHLRPLLAQTVAQTNLLLDLRPPASTEPQLVNAIAAVALLVHPAVLIDSGASLVLEPTPEHSELPDQSEQSTKPAPPPPAPPPGVYLPYVPYVPPPVQHKATAPKQSTPEDPLTAWYRKLLALHQSNAVLRSGSKVFLDFDAQDTLVWVARPASPSPASPPIVTLCNLSPAPVQFSLAAAMKELNLQGFFLRPLLRSDNGLGAQDINAVTLPPFGVYIGELRR